MASQLTEAQQTIYNYAHAYKSHFYLTKAHNAGIIATDQIPWSWILEDGDYFSLENALAVYRVFVHGDKTKTRKPTGADVLRYCISRGAYPTSVASVHALIQKKAWIEHLTVREVDCILSRFKDMAEADGYHLCILLRDLPETTSVVWIAAMMRHRMFHTARMFIQCTYSVEWSRRVVQEAHRTGQAAAMLALTTCAYPAHITVNLAQHYAALMCMQQITRAKAHTTDAFSYMVSYLIAASSSQAQPAITVDINPLTRRPVIYHNGRIISKAVYAAESAYYLRSLQTHSSVIHITRFDIIMFCGYVDLFAADYPSLHARLPFVPHNHPWANRRDLLRHPLYVLGTVMSVNVRNARERAIAVHIASSPTFYAMPREMTELILSYFLIKDEFPHLFTIVD